MSLWLGVLGGQITSPTFGWRQFGTNSNDVINDVAIDPSGNIYVVGTTFGTLPGNSSSGGSDAFISKYSPTGELLWVRQLGSSGNDEGLAVCYSQIYDLAIVGGTCSGSISGQTHNGGTDGFIAAYDINGSQLYVRLIGSSGNDGITSLLFSENDGYVYAGGFAEGSISGQTYGGSRDFLLAKYSPAGSLMWIRLSGQSVTDRINSVGESIYTGNIIVTGETANGTFFGAPAVGGNDIFIARYSTSGSRLSSTLSCSTSDNDYSYKIISNPNNGDIYICGTTYGSMNISRIGINDGFIAKFNSAGVLQSRSQFGIVNSNTEARSISFNSDYSEIICVGTTNGSLPGYTNSGGTDIFIRRVSTLDLSLINQYQYGTSGNDSAVSSVSSGNNIILSGSTTGAFTGANSGGTDAVFGRFTSQGVLAD